MSTGDTVTLESPESLYDVERCISSKYDSLKTTFHMPLNRTSSMMHWL